ncbi:GAF domain-containing protein [Roseibium sp.]|uniref:GAF domain-containing protein n=1 Tax=Roseibium sp. TaxID=1936156 RepID=UPI003D0B8FDF
MTDIPLESLRRSMEGIVAAFLATCDADGVPNVSMISQVHYVDSQHVALSYQFFNKTRRNVLLTRMATVLVTDPVTLAVHRLDLDYEETRTGGPVFEVMKAKLAGIASHHGMEGVFRLLGADIYKVRSVEAASYWKLLPAPAEHYLLAVVRRCMGELDGCEDLESLLELSLECLERHFGIHHAMILMAETDAQRLYTVASRGYDSSGVGSEVMFGEGVIGVAARERTPIRIGHMTTEYRYGATLRDTARKTGIVASLPDEIPFPGLKNPRSQIALPIVLKGKLLGVLFAESEETMRFGYDEEDALMLVAQHLGTLFGLLQQDLETAEPIVETACPEPHDVVTVRYHPHDQSVFIGHDYLIKGVAGTILWKLLTEFQETGRTEFTTRELRVDPSLRLPEYSENLDARLILLRKRLDERQACLRLEKCGRGRFLLRAPRSIRLEKVSGSAADAAQ